MNTVTVEFGTGMKVVRFHGMQCSARRLFQIRPVHGIQLTVTTNEISQ